MAGTGDPRRRRVLAVVMAVVAVFGLGVAAGTQLVGGGGTKAAVPAGLPAVTAGPSADSAPGALDAAARYATVLAQLFPLDPDSARQVLAGDASDAYRATLVATVDSVLVPMQQQMAALSGHPVFRQSVLAEKIDSFAPARAAVSVWLMVVAGQSGVADNAVSSFSTVDLQLVFQAGAWRIDGTGEHPGPSPQMSGAPTSVDATVAALAGFNDWRPR